MVTNLPHKSCCFMAYKLFSFYFYHNKAFKNVVYSIFSSKKILFLFYLQHLWYFLLSFAKHWTTQRENRLRESLSVEKKGKKINAMWLPHRTETFFLFHPSLAVSPKVSNNTCLSQHPLIAHVFATLWFFGSPTQRWTVTWFLLLLTLPFLLPVFWK